MNGSAIVSYSYAIVVDDPVRVGLHGGREIKRATRPRVRDSRVIRGEPVRASELIRHHHVPREVRRAFVSFVTTTFRPPRAYHPREEKLSVVIREGDRIVPFIARQRRHPPHHARAVRLGEILILVRVRHRRRDASQRRLQRDERRGVFLRAIHRRRLDVPARRDARDAHVEATSRTAARTTVVVRTTSRISLTLFARRRVVASGGEETHPPRRVLLAPVAVDESHARPHRWEVRRNIVVRRGRPQSVSHANFIPRAVRRATRPRLRVRGPRDVVTSIIRLVIRREEQFSKFVGEGRPGGGIDAGRERSETLAGERDARVVVRHGRGDVRGFERRVLGGDGGGGAVVDDDAPRRPRGGDEVDRLVGVGGCSVSAASGGCSVSVSVLASVSASARSMATRRASARRMRRSRRLRAASVLARESATDATSPLRSNAISVSRPRRGGGGSSGVRRFPRGVGVRARFARRWISTHAATATKSLMVDAG